jgi:hypothetical protein
VVSVANAKPTVVGVGGSLVGAVSKDAKVHEGDLF